ncbi:MAG: hypothetical protein IPO52_04015 [Gemmatimonadetes bacterium]|nr:hypothetical protein [Gemmatimonadota bacterium]
MIEYRLPKAGSVVQIQILDSAGVVVNSYASVAPTGGAPVRRRDQQRPPPT